MLRHTVFFWLNEGGSNSDASELESALRSLTRDPAVSSGYVGKPAGTPERDVVDHSYDYALVLTFEDVAAHDRYQVGAVHERFVKANSDKWERVLVYDIGS